MGLHDRIKGGVPNGGGPAVGDNGMLTVTEAPAERPSVMDPYAELKTRIHHACITKLGPQLFSTETTDDILGYGPLEPFLRDDSVTEVMVNAFDRIYIEREGKLERTLSTFADNAHLLRIIDKIVSQIGRRVDEASPMVDARLPDGSRVNAIIPPLALRGPTLTVRKFSRDPYTM